MLKSKLADIRQNTSAHWDVLRVTDQGTLNFCAHPGVRASFPLRISAPHELNFNQNLRTLSIPKENCTFPFQTNPKKENSQKVLENKIQLVSLSNYSTRNNLKFA